MSEVEPVDGGARGRGVRLGEPEACLLRAEELEERPLLRVVGAGRVAERGPDAAIPLGDEVGPRELLVGRVPGTPCALVEPLRERLGEPVGEGLVMIAL